MDVNGGEIFAAQPQSRAAAFRRDLSRDVIDIAGLKTLTSGGVPEEDKGLRALVWKLLLGYLPPHRSHWDNTIKRKQAEYRQFCQELIIDPKTLGKPPDDCPLGAPDGLQRRTVSEDDHPLSTSHSSKWHAYFADEEIRDQIHRDVDRTHPDLHFFSDDGPRGQACRAAMRRALFIFAKLNPGLRYVQGMNELMAPLYYTFATAVDDPVEAEAEAFFCFVDLLGEFRDHFCQQLDNSDVGIRSTMSKLSASLRAFDPALSAHLEGKNQVNPQFYAFRWITTLLTQEYPFPDAVRLWDALLADAGGRSDFLQRVCVAMVLLVREELLVGDFAGNMKLLQHYPPMDLSLVLRKAEQLRQYKTVIVVDDNY